MPAIDAVTLGVTVGLGVISVILAIFAIWLSLKFSKDSSAALAELATVAAEIRTLTEGVFSQQDRLSTRMLDSILEAGPYGNRIPENRPEQAVAEIIRERVTEAETRMANDVEAKVRALLASSSHDSAAIRSTIDAIREDVSALSSAVSNVSDVGEIDAAVRDEMESWSEYPGLAVLMAIVVEQEAKSESEIREHVDAYHLPIGWKEALEIWLDSDVLTGSLQAFELSEEYKLHAARWVAANRDVIRQIVAAYAASSESESEKDRLHKIMGIARRLGR